MNSALLDALNEFLKALLYLASLVILYFVVPYLRAKANEKKYAEFRQKAEEAVRYLEQVKKGFGVTNDELAARARLIMQDAADEMGLKIDVDEIVRIIEAAIHAVNAEKGPTLTVETLSGAGNE